MVVMSVSVEAVQLPASLVWQRWRKVRQMPRVRRKNVFVPIFFAFVLQSVKRPAAHCILLKGNFNRQSNIDILCTACLA
jgi:hypothetical protein